MKAADWVLLAVVLASIIQAVRAGFLREAFGLAGLVLGYLLAAWKYGSLAGWLESFLKSQAFSEVAGFLAIFLGVTILASIAGRVARWAAKESGLSFVDRILGGVLGLVRGCLIVIVVLMAMTAFSPASQWLQDSLLAPYFLVVGRAAIWVAPSEMRARFYQGLDLLHHAAQPIAPGKQAGH